MVKSFEPSLVLCIKGKNFSTPILSLQWARPCAFGKFVELVGDTFFSHFFQATTSNVECGYVSFLLAFLSKVVITLYSKKKRAIELERNL